MVIPERQVRSSWYKDWDSSIILSCWRLTSPSIPAVVLVPEVWTCSSVRFVSPDRAVKSSAVTVPMSRSTVRLVSPETKDRSSKPVTTSSKSVRLVKLDNGLKSLTWLAGAELFQFPTIRKAVSSVRLASGVRSEIPDGQGSTRD